MRKKPNLEEELTYDEFLDELEEMKMWISKRTRRRASWYWSVVDYCEGRR